MYVSTSHFISPARCLCMKTILLALTVLVALPLPLPFFSAPEPVAQETVLVTGFEPFGPWDSNPSGEVALALNGTLVGDVRILGVMLPVTFGTSYLRLQEYMAACDPVAVIALGLDGTARWVEVERIALNLQHPSLWRFSRINDSGPPVRCTTLPTRAIVAALREEAIAARPSWFAGLYVCNYVFYRLQEDAQQGGIPAGFIHVPPTPSQKPYGMELATTLQAVRTAINVTMAA